MFSFSVVDACAGDLEWRNLIVIVLVCIDIDLGASDPRVAGQHIVDFGRRGDIVVVAEIQHVVGQNQHFDELYNLQGAREPLVSELRLNTVGLATKVGGIAEVVGVTGRTSDINLQLPDLGLEVLDSLLLNLVRTRLGLLGVLLHHLHVGKLGTGVGRHSVYWGVLYPSVVILNPFYGKSWA
jgi:hypothetical protein